MHPSFLRFGGSNVYFSLKQYLTFICFPMTYPLLRYISAITVSPLKKYTEKDVLISALSGPCLNSTSPQHTSSGV